MTTATQRCAPTPLLKVIIATRQGQWAMPDRAAHCDEPYGEEAEPGPTCAATE